MVFDNENLEWDERLAGCQQAIGVRFDDLEILRRRIKLVDRLEPDHVGALEEDEEGREGVDGGLEAIVEIGHVLTSVGRRGPRRGATLATNI